MYYDFDRNTLNYIIIVGFKSPSQLITPPYYYLFLFQMSVLNLLCVYKYFIVKGHESIFEETYVPRGVQKKG